MAIGSSVAAALGCGGVGSVSAASAIGGGAVIGAGATVGFEASKAAIKRAREEQKEK